MHLFHNILNSIADDLTAACDDLEDFLFADWYAAARSKSACKILAPRTLTDYNLAIQAAPTDANLFYGRGTVRYRYHDRAGALADYNFALELNPRLASAYAARAISYIHLDRLAEAIAD
jgi:tetratricopeptide (TPR) repeat protein